MADGSESTREHPWGRYVAIGDSFTEGIGDAEPASPGGHRGWADRVAEVLAASTDGFSYANLAIRGRLLDQISREQTEAALHLSPDLISVSAGGNDLLRPGTDPDELSVRFEAMITRLRRDGATVLMFTGPDIGRTPVLGRIRGKIAVFNENIRQIARRHDALVADMWALPGLADPRMWAPDRLHFSPVGHTAVAAMALDTLGIHHELEPYDPEPLPPVRWRQARVEDLSWAREYFAPWVMRRVRHQSSGDNVVPKRPGY